MTRIKAVFYLPLKDNDGRSLAYSVSLDENAVPELERILRDFRGKTTQEAIYLEIQRAVDVRFIQ